MTRWAMAATLLVAGSCAPVTPGLLADDAPYDTGLAERTFGFVYTQILERHLSDHTAQSVALEAMKGFSNIDPEIAVTLDGDRLLLNASDRLVAEYPAPSENDIKGWSRLSVTLALDARALSTIMQKANLEEVLQASFDATLAKLDTFSRYSGAAEAKENRASRNGFGGLGIRFDFDDAGEAKITEVLPETPAQRAGLKVDDLITHVDGERVLGLAKPEISKKLRGPVSSNVLVTVRRGLAHKDVDVTRDLIVPPTVTAKYQDGVGILKISSFNQRTAVSVEEELRALMKSGQPLTGVVMDLRGNPGGLLDQAVALSDLFMPHGTIVSTRGRHIMSNQSYSASAGDLAENLPVVVLVDGRSASSSEIVTAALQDAGRAVVIGSNSYGKGTVQTVLRLPNDGEMTLTWSRFHTPSGYALHGLGVLPTLCTSDSATQKAMADEEKKSAQNDNNGVGGDVTPQATTSVDDVSPVQVAQAVNAAKPLASQMAAWRATSIEATKERQELRATCPSVKLENRDSEIQMALELLNNPGLYAEAMAVSLPGSSYSTKAADGSGTDTQRAGNQSGKNLR